MINETAVANEQMDELALFSGTLTLQLNRAFLFEEIVSS
jgi:hypothetical protein